MTTFFSRSPSLILRLLLLLLLLLVAAQTAEGAWTTIAYDDFETGWGNFVTGGNDASRVRDKTVAHEGQFSARIRDDSGEKSSIYYSSSYDLTSYADLRVSFWFYSDNLNGNEDFVLEYSKDDGNSWEIVKQYIHDFDFINGFFTQSSVYFANQNCCVLTNQAKLRFRCDASGNRDRIYLDEIRLEGLGVGAPTTSEPTTLPPSTSAPTTSAPTTLPPSTSAPTTLSPSTSAPTTLPPSTPAPTTLPPSTSAPTSLPPSTPAPNTLPPSTSVPTTLPPSTSVPTTVPPSTSVPTTLPPSTSVPTTLPPSTSAPTTLPPSTSAPTMPLTADDICPINRRYPPERYEITPFLDLNPNDSVQDDLNEISYIAYSTQTDANGNRYAYMASDKEQYSLKVVRFTHNIFDSGDPFHGRGNTEAVYTLFTKEPLNDDWEDISLGPCTDEGTAVYTSQQICIYIGNIGNNNRFPKPQRKELYIYKFVEPEIGPSGPQDQSVSFATIGYYYGDGFDQSVDKYYDAESLFVDWTGGAGTDSAGDIYIATKSGCSGGVGKIPVNQHKNLAPGDAIGNYNMLRVVDDPPPQGQVTCGEGPFRAWTGADMRRDGRLIAMIREESPAAVFFFSRLAPQTIAEALSVPSCGYVASTSVGLPNEKKHEAVAFVDPEGLRFADISECEGSCTPTLYQYVLEYADSDFPVVIEPTEGWETITLDDFENESWGNYMPGGVHAVLSDETACNGFCACEGLWAVKLEEDRGALSSISHISPYACDTYAFLRITFTFKFRGYDLLDTLFLEISLDSGATYFIIGDWAHSVKEYPNYNDPLTNAICYTANVLLTPEQFRVQSFENFVKLRFRNSGNAANDRVYVDQILFEGNSGLETVA